MFPPVSTAHWEEQVHTNFTVYTQKCKEDYSIENKFGNALLKLFQIKRLHLLLTVKESAIDVPTNLEARRRITFFANSLFMDMPRAPRVRKMRAFRFFLFF